LHSADPAKAIIELHCANMCRNVIAAARDAVELHRAGQISDQQLRDTVVGHGHHRLIATRS